MSTAFTNVFGDTPQVRLLDFLAANLEFDYTISQMSAFAGVSRPTLCGLVDRGSACRGRPPGPHADGRAFALLPDRPGPSRRPLPAAPGPREGAGRGGGGVRGVAALPNAKSSETAGPARIVTGDAEGLALDRVVSGNIRIHAGSSCHD